MQHFPAVQIVHSEGNVFSDLNHSVFIDFGLFLVQVIEQTALLKVLSDEIVKI